MEEILNGLPVAKFMIAHTHFKGICVFCTFKLRRTMQTLKKAFKVTMTFTGDYFFLLICDIYKILVHIIHTALNIQICSDVCALSFCLR